MRLQKLIAKMKKIGNCELGFYDSLIDRRGGGCTKISYEDGEWFWMSEGQNWYDRWEKVDEEEMIEHMKKREKDIFENGQLTYEKK